jgi:Cse1
MVVVVQPPPKQKQLQLHACDHYGKKSVPHQRVCKLLATIQPPVSAMICFFVPDRGDSARTKDRRWGATAPRRILTLSLAIILQIHLIVGAAVQCDIVSFGMTQSIRQHWRRFQQQIIPELQDPSTVANRRLVKAAAIQFIATFRFQLRREQLIEMINHLLIYFYKSLVGVIHTYAAYCLPTQRNESCFSPNKVWMVPHFKSSVHSQYRFWRQVWKPSLTDCLRLPNKSTSGP